MQVKIVTHYSVDDLDFCGDYWSVDVYIDDEFYVSYGDSYHDKGHEKVEGLLDGLRYFELLDIEEENIADAEG